MSLYVDDEQFAGDLATNSGWYEFGQWTGDLSTKDFELVIHLWEHGWVDDLKILAKQLRKAAQIHVPPEGVDEVIQAILRAIRTASNVVWVSDGLSDGEGEADEEEDENEDDN